MSEDLDFCKLLMGGKTWEELTAMPNLEAVPLTLSKRLITKYDLRILGQTKAGELLTVTEEERTHTHIIAGTGEGKSKHIEKNCQLDIDRIIKYPNQPGIALLDATDQAQTAYNVLKYCIHRGYEKVCVIDPKHYDTFKRVAAISMFKYRPHLKWACINAVNNTLQVTSEIRDPAQTKRIQRYLRGLLSVLWDAGSP